MAEAKWLCMGHGFCSNKNACPVCTMAEALQAYHQCTCESSDQSTFWQWKQPWHQVYIEIARNRSAQGLKLITMDQCPYQNLLNVGTGQPQNAANSLGDTVRQAQLSGATAAVSDKLIVVFSDALASSFDHWRVLHNRSLCCPQSSCLV